MTGRERRAAARGLKVWREVLGLLRKRHARAPRGARYRVLRLPAMDLA